MLPRVVGLGGIVVTLDSMVVTPGCIVVRISECDDVIGKKEKEPVMST